MKIQYIAIHHSGGVANDYYASSRFLEYQNIDDAHRVRWNFPSQYIPKSYGGYNFGYDPKTRVFHQFRAIGEETAAQIGYNFNTISVCIYGNYTKLPGQQISVDRMDSTMERDIATFVLNLISGNHKHIVVPGTVIDLSETRVHPHRWYQKSTECYGNALSDTWINDLLAKYKQNSNTGELEQRISLLQQIIKLQRLIKSLREKKQKKPTLAAMQERSCTGHLIE